MKSTPFSQQTAVLGRLCVAVLWWAAAVLTPARAYAQGSEPGTDDTAPSIIYIVRAGDTLTAIARRYGTRVEALVAANGIANPGLILIGQELVIPVLPETANTASSPAQRNGLAMAVHAPQDLVRLQVDWYYIWSWCYAPGCIPMVHGMELPPACPPILLVGNEPNAIRPFGSPTTPTEAVGRVRAIERQCPATRLVVGNVAADDWRPAGGWGSGYDWLAEFLPAYQAAAGVNFAHTLGVHCYAQFRAGYCVEQLGQLRGLYAGPMWLTEFGLLSGDARQFVIMVDYANAHFERYAAYTNRQPHTGQGWEISPGVELVRPDGELTPAGIVYAGD